MQQVRLGSATSAFGFGEAKHRSLAADRLLPVAEKRKLGCPLISKCFACHSSGKEAETRINNNSDFKLDACRRSGCVGIRLGRGPDRDQGLEENSSTLSVAFLSASGHGGPTSFYALTAKAVLDYLLSCSQHQLGRGGKHDGQMIGAMGPLIRTLQLSRDTTRNLHGISPAVHG